MVEKQRKGCPYAIDPKPAHLMKSCSSRTGMSLVRAFTRRLRSLVSRTTSRTRCRTSPSWDWKSKFKETQKNDCKPFLSSTFFLQRLRAVSRILSSFDFCSLDVCSSLVNVAVIKTFPCVVTYLRKTRLVERSRGSMGKALLNGRIFRFEEN